MEEVLILECPLSDKNSEHQNSDSRKGGSRLIGKILPPAVRFWLRSQVEQVDNLEVVLAGRDRQILKGYIPGVKVVAQEVIYKGLYVSEVNLSAGGIRINTGQVVRGKPLRLLQSFPVLGRVVLSAGDVERSVRSPLLRTGLLEFWRSLVCLPAVSQAVEAHYGPLPLQPDVVLFDLEIQIAESCLGLSFYPVVRDFQSDTRVVLATQLSIADRQYLQLHNPMWLSSLEQLEGYAAGSMVGQPIQPLEGFRWNLGRETSLTALEISPVQLICEGQVAVQP